MARYSEALWKPVSWANRAAQARGRTPNVLIFHVAVSESKSLQAFFERSINSSPVCSHFYVRRDGTVEQYIDTKYISAADREGSRRSISVETQGGVKNPDGEKWTPQQVQALAELAKWANKTHKIPLKTTPDSRTSTAGVSWHRRGIEGNFGTEGNKYAYIRGEHWSGYGKLCPGLAKIKQVPDVIAAAKGEDNDGFGDMMSYKEIRHELRKDMAEVTRFHVPKAEMLSTRKDANGNPIKSNIASEIRLNAIIGEQVRETAMRTQGKVDALIAAVQQLSGGQIDMEAINKAAFDGAAEALQQAARADAAELAELLEISVKEEEELEE